MASFPDWIYRQSAVLPYRLRDGGPEVLLITSRRGRRWVLPKGIVEPGMTPAVSAAKEAREEAGIEGAVSEQSLGSYRQKKWGGRCRVEVFPMRVTAEHADWPEARIRRREWLPLKAAIKRVDRKKLNKILHGLPEQLEREPEKEVPATVIEEPRLIYLMRHAKSSRDDPALVDFDRPLAERGRATGEIMSAYLQVADVAPGRLLCSPAMRTRQTLAGIRAVVGQETEARFDEVLYHGGPNELLAELRRLPDGITSVMLIGHNPALQVLALHLGTGGDPEALDRMAAAFPTGSLATLVVKPKRWRDLAPGTCDLHSFVTPSDLA